MGHGKMGKNKKENGKKATLIILFLLIFVSNANADLYLASRTGSIYFNTSDTARMQIFSGGNLTLLGMANLSVPGNIDVGGGYSGGGISLIGVGSEKGSGQFAKDIMIDGQIVAISDVEINKSFIPTRDLFSLLGNATNRFLTAYVVNVMSGNTTLVLNANVSIAGNLTVDAGLKVVGDINATGSVWALGTNLSALGTAAAGWTDDGSGIRLTTATDLVGIGAAAPEAKLHVRVNDTNNISTTNVLILEHIIQNPLNSTGGIGAGILIRGVDNGSNIDDIALINATLTSAINGSESSSLGFYTREAGGSLTPRLVINGSNVGIGTTEPTQPLHVVGDTNITGSLFVQGKNLSTFSNVSVLHAYNQSGGNFAPLSIDAGGNLLINVVEEGGAINLAAGAAGVDLTLTGALIANSFNVTSASQNATFNGDVRILGTLYGGSPLKVGSGINISVGSGEDSLFVSDSAGNKLFRITDTGMLNITSSAGNTSFDSETLFIDATNNRVGIGTASPNYLLQVASGTDGRSVNLSNVFYVNGSSGYVGIGTASPQNKLEVIGATTLAGGVNASSLNVTGFSIADDSLVTLSDGSKKKIKDVITGEEVLTLEETTGKLVPRKVNALLDHGIKPIYEMATEDGRAINTTGEHPYLIKLYDKELCDKYANNVWNKEYDDARKPTDNSESVFGTNSVGFNNYCTRWVEIRDLAFAQSVISNSSSSAINNLPLNSVTLDSRINPLSSAKDANLPFLVPFSAYSAECPLDTIHFLSSFGIFSSSWNLSIYDTMASAHYLSSPFQSILNHNLVQTWIVIPKDLLDRDTISYKLNYIANQNSGASESGLSMADFAVRNDVFTNFNSHKANNGYEIFKGFEIAVPDYSTDAIKWKKIISIKALEPQHVYDLSIEGTRNFIANDIVAHNTYLATSSGNVGIGTTAPSHKLTVNGNVNITNGNFSIGDWEIRVNASVIEVYVSGTREKILDSDGNLRIKGDITTRDETV